MDKKDKKIIMTFGSRVEAIMYSLRAAMGTTFGLYASPDQMPPDDERLAFIVPLWAASKDRDFTNIRGVNIVIDTSYASGSVKSINQFESDWLAFINDPRGCGRACLSAWFHDEAEDVLYLGFCQDGADNHVDPNNQMTWYEEWGYNPDPPIWLRVKVKPRDLENFVQLEAHYFWSTKYQLQK